MLHMLHLKEGDTKITHVLGKLGYAEARCSLRYERLMADPPGCKGMEEEALREIREVLIIEEAVTKKLQGGGTGQRRVVRVILSYREM